MEVAIKEGKYLYCIIGASTSLSANGERSRTIGLSQPRTFGPLGIGERGDELHAVYFNDIAVVISNCPIKTYPLSRQNLLDHEKAIEEVMEEYTVLPIRFSTIAESEDKIRLILEKEYDNFKDLLNKLEDKKELGLKAIFKEELIYKELLEKYEDIKSLKEAISSEPPAKTYYQRMEIGRKVETALQKEKDICKEEILNALSPLAQDTKVNTPYGELMIISAAFLVENSREAEFDQNVQALADKYGDKIKFKYTGTLPPFNFVNLVIETGKY